MSLKRKLRRNLPPREWPPGDTKVTLVRDLGTKPQSAARDQLMQRAAMGYYHDFESELETPKVQLYRDLKGAGFDDLAEKVKEGGYDHEPPTLEQQEQMRRDVGAEFYDSIMATPPRGQG